MPTHRPSRRSLSPRRTLRLETPKEVLKERLRESLSHKSSYTASSHYHKTGFCQRIARSQRFENIVLAVISFNALWIWIDVDYNDASSLLDAHPVFIIVEVSFCIVFSFEWICRFGAVRHKRDCCKDSWFLFDSSLVFLMIMETFVLTFLTESGIIDFGEGIGHLSVLRLLRLFRLTRMAKLMSYIPEMVILTKGIAEGMRSVSLTLVLLAMLIYGVAVVMKQMSSGTSVGAEYFATVPNAMYTLLIHGMVPDIGDVMFDLQEEWYIAIFFACFVFFSTFAILNLLIGILCGVVTTVKHQEKEHMNKEWLKRTLKKVMVEQIDKDHDGLVSKAEFLAILDIPDAVSALTKLGFDLVALVDLAEILFESEKRADDDQEVALTFDEFITVLLESRSSQPATQKDIRELQKYILQVCDPTVSNQERSMAMSLSSALNPKLEESDGSEADLLVPSDGEQILTGLHELHGRVDALEELATSVAESQPELAQRLSSLEVLVLKVADTQRQLLHRLPSEEVLRKFNHVISSLHEKSFFGPSLHRGFRQSRSQSPETKRELDPCRSLLAMQDYR